MSSVRTGSGTISVTNTTLANNGVGVGASGCSTVITSVADCAVADCAGDGITDGGYHLSIYASCNLAANASIRRITRTRCSGGLPMMAVPLKRRASVAKPAISVVPPGINGGTRSITCGSIQFKVQLKNHKKEHLSEIAI